VTQSWWNWLLPVEVPLECGGELHHLRWEDGSLVALDHPDPDGERALGALGADRTACIEVLDAWARYSDDLRVLTLSSRGVADPVQVDAEGFSGTGVNRIRPGRGFVRSAVALGGSGWTASAHLGAHPMMQGPSPGPLDEITRLLALGGALSQRLVATVIAAWSDRIAAGGEVVEGHLPELTAALYGRVTSSVRSWLSDAALEVQLEMIPASESPSIHLEGQLVTVRLPFLWLSEIWVRDLSVVLNWFALRTISSDQGELRLLAISPNFSEVRPITVRLD
jgi:hypothetical protein